MDDDMFQPAKPEEEAALPKGETRCRLVAHSLGSLTDLDSHCVKDHKGDIAKDGHPLREGCQ